MAVDWAFPDAMNIAETRLCITEVRSVGKLTVSWFIVDIIIYNMYTTKVKTDGNLIDRTFFFENQKKKSKLDLAG